MHLLVKVMLLKFKVTNTTVYQIVNQVLLQLKIALDNLITY